MHSPFGGLRGLTCAIDREVHMTGAALAALPLMQPVADFDFSQGLTTSGSEITGVANAADPANPLIVGGSTGPQTGQTINGRAAAQFNNGQWMRMTSELANVRAIFVVTQDVRGQTGNGKVAPIVGCEVDSPGGQQYVYVNGSTSQDFDWKLAGTSEHDDETGRVWYDGSADDADPTNSKYVQVTFGMNLATKRAPRIWMIFLDQPMTNLQAIGYLKAAATEYFSDGTLFGRVIMFEDYPQAAQINAIGAELASDWGIPWTQKSFFYIDKGELLSTGLRADQGVCASPTDWDTPVLFTTGGRYTSSVPSSGSGEGLNVWAWDGESAGALLHTYNGLHEAGLGQGAQVPLVRQRQINGMYLDADRRLLYVSTNNWNGSQQNPETYPTQGYVAVFSVAANGALTHVRNHDVGEVMNEGVEKINGQFWTSAHDSWAFQVWDESADGTTWTKVADVAHDGPTYPSSHGWQDAYQDHTIRQDAVALANLHGINSNLDTGMMQAFRIDGLTAKFIGERVPNQPSNFSDGGATQGLQWHPENAHLGHVLCAYRRDYNGNGDLWLHRVSA